MTRKKKKPYRWLGEELLRETGRIFWFWEQETPGSICRICRKTELADEHQEPEQGTEVQVGRVLGKCTQESEQRPGGMRPQVKFSRSQIFLP